MLDEPIKQTSKVERATYDTINDAAETDMKSLYDRQEELQDALDEPQNIANRTSLQKELYSTQDAIKTGEANVHEKLGEDASDLIEKAKATTQQRFAMETLKQKLFNNENVVDGNVAAGVPETINIKSAIRSAENLDKPSKYTPEGTPTRLQQAMGVEGAAKFKKGLYDAQKSGQTALSRQRIAKLVGIAGAGYLGLHFGGLGGLALGVAAEPIAGKILGKKR
jgi:phosphoribosyl-ATP pyrophosphohydrolase